MSRRRVLGAAGALIVAAATGVRRRPARAQSAAGHSKARKIVVGRQPLSGGAVDHPVHARQRAPGSRSGTTRLHSLLVQPEHLADRFKDAMLPPVFATPIMIVVMENAALNAIRAYLDPGEIAVGTAVNVRHLAATPVGRLVTGEAEVTKSTGGKSSSASEQLRGPRKSGPARIHRRGKIHAAARMSNA
jgi:predicted thioesterase